MNGFVIRIAILALALSMTAISSNAQAAAEYDSLVQKGRSQLQAGTADMALGTAETAAHLAPKRWEAYALAGGALISLDRYNDAIDKLSQAILLAPEAKQAALRELRRQCLVKQAASASPAPTSTSQAEIVLWKSVEESNDPAQLQSYLQQYPNGAFASVARARIAHENEVQARNAAFADSVHPLVDQVNAAGETFKTANKKLLDFKFQLEAAGFCRLHYKEVATYKTDKDTWGAAVTTMFSYGLHSPKEIDAIINEGQIDLASIDPTSVKVDKDGDLVFKGKEGLPAMNGRAASVTGIGKAEALTVSGQCSSDGHNEQGYKCESKTWRPETAGFELRDANKARAVLNEFTRELATCSGTQAQ